MIYFVICEVYFSVVYVYSKPYNIVFLKAQMVFVHWKYVNLILFW